MSSREGQVVVETRDLAKTFRLGFRRRKVEALRGVSFEVRRGEIFGFLGPNGAGKTTTIKLLMGLLRPTQGSCSILGRPVSDLEARRRLGYLPESPYFYDHLLPDEFMDLCGRLRSIPAAERARRGAKLLELVGLASAVDRPLRKFSKGMLQRIGLAQALVGDPELLVLDEPMTGLDPIGRKEVRDLIVDLRKEGKTIFFSSHILSDVEMICDRVAIVDQGKIVAKGSLDELLAPAERIVDVEIEGGDPSLREKLEGLSSGMAEERGALHVTVKGEGGISEVLKVATEAGANIRAVIPRRESLEGLFVRRALGSHRAER